MEDTNDDGYTLTDWLTAVDAALMTRCGMDNGCLADRPYWDEWNDSVSPDEAAAECLEYNGFPAE